MRKLVMIGAVAVAATVGGSAVAAEFYVVRDASTKKCTIVDNGTFKTRTEAETGMKTMKVCTSN